MITAKPASWTTDEFTLNSPRKNKIHDVIISDAKIDKKFPPKTVS